MKYDVIISTEEPPGKKSPSVFMFGVQVNNLFWQIDNL